MVCVTGRGWCKLQWFARLNEARYFESEFEGGKLQLGIWTAKEAPDRAGITASGRDGLRLQL